MRDAFVEEISAIAKKDKDLFFITGDLGFGVFEEFEKEFPNQYLNTESLSASDNIDDRIMKNLQFENQSRGTYGTGF